nr:uncharacterized protein LOC127316210 [Lolium perenne]
MKDSAGVGEELRQIYLPGRRSHHPNGAPCQRTPSPKYHAKNGIRIIHTELVFFFSSLVPSSCLVDLPNPNPTQRQRIPPHIPPPIHSRRRRRAVVSASTGRFRPAPPSPSRSRLPPRVSAIAPLTTVPIFPHRDAVFLLSPTPSAIFGHLVLRKNTMEIRPMVALRAALVGGVAAFAKIAGAMKAAGGVKVGAAAAAMTAAATAAVSGKDTANDNQKPGGK